MTVDHTAVAWPVGLGLDTHRDGKPWTYRGKEGGGGALNAPAKTVGGGIRCVQLAVGQP